MSEVKMSNSVKVGDQFKLPVHVGDRGAIVQSDGERIDYLKLDLMVSCIAINSYDQLQQENAELRDLLQQQREKIVELYSIGQFKVRVDVSEVLTKSEELLSKND